MLQPLKAGSEL